MQVWLPASKYPDPGAVSRFYQELLRRVQRVHGVSAAAVVNTRPFLGWALGARLQIPGHGAQPDDPIVDFRVISPGYFSALRAALLRGRSLDDADGPTAAPMALINSTMLQRYFQTGDPIGQAIRLRLLGSAISAPWWPEQTADTYKIVGVVQEMNVDSS